MLNQTPSFESSRRKKKDLIRYLALSGSQVRPLNEYRSTSTERISFDIARRLASTSFLSNDSIPSLASMRTIPNARTFVTRAALVVDRKAFYLGSPISTSLASEARKRIRDGNRITILLVVSQRAVVI